MGSPSIQAARIFLKRLVQEFEFSRQPSWREEVFQLLCEVPHTPISHY